MQLQLFNIFLHLKILIPTLQNDELLHVASLHIIPIKFQVIPLQEDEYKCKAYVQDVTTYSSFSSL